MVRPSYCCARPCKIPVQSTLMLRKGFRARSHKTPAQGPEKNVSMDVTLLISQDVYEMILLQPIVRLKLLALWM